MPNETQTAVQWSLLQDGVSTDEPWTVVDKVREYFNKNNISYTTFSYNGLIPYL